MKTIGAKTEIFFRMAAQMKRAFQARGAAVPAVQDQIGE